MRMKEHKMSIAGVKTVTENAKTTCLRITDYGNKVMCGSMKNCMFPEERKFGSLTQMILMLNGMLDEISYPQRSTEIRTFSQRGKEKNCEAEAAEAKTLNPFTEVISTFSIKILFRQNSDWQGRISWCEGRTEENFRSVIELITIMDDALETAIAKKEQKIKHA